MSSKRMPIDSEVRVTAHKSVLPSTRPSCEAVLYVYHLQRNLSSLLWGRWWGLRGRSALWRLGFVYQAQKAKTASQERW